MQVKLNLGAGDKPLDGYIPIDRKTGHEAYPLPANVTDVNYERVYLNENTVDEIRASHILEHFSYHETPDVLKEWVRVLKPGGEIKIAVPDYGWIRAHPEHPLAEAYLFGGHVDGNDRHGAMFTYEKLHRLMTEAGLVDIKPWKSEIDDCASLPVSLNLRGIKRDPNEPTKPKRKIPPTMAVMSVGRWGLTDFWVGLINNLVLPFKMGVTTHKGVFWGHALERLMDRAIAGGYSWILTLDHDTAFTAKDVVNLLSLMHDHPEADAIAPLQAKRASDEILAHIAKPGGHETKLKMTDEIPLIKVDAAHFGLTLIRVSALLKVPHPWFHAVPNEYGRWDEGRKDEDISFWAKWKEAGNSLYLAHRVAVGHIQEMTTFPMEDGSVGHSFVSEFFEVGKPEGVRK